MKLVHLIKNEFQTPVTVTVPTVVTVESEKPATVTTVTAVTVTNAKNSKIHWQAFVDECINHGVAAEEVAAMFRQQDKADLCEEPVEKLSLHAATIAEAIKRKRTAGESDNSNAHTVNPAHLKCCIDCQHFNRIQHQNLGNCDAGEPEGIAGNLDTDLRNYCQSFQAVTL